MKSGDDGLFFIQLAGHDLEEDLTGKLFRPVDILTAEGDFPDLGMQRLQLQRGKIGVAHRFPHGVENGFTGGGKGLLGEFAPGLLRKE